MPGRHFTYCYWTPFDPTQTVAIYHLMYAYEVICLWVAAVHNVYTDIFVFVVFIVVNFAIALLCERIKSIGARNDAVQCEKRRALVKIAVYGELIDFIKVHYKISR